MFIGTLQCSAEKMSMFLGRKIFQRTVNLRQKASLYTNITDHGGRLVSNVRTNIGHVSGLDMYNIANLAVSDFPCRHISSSAVRFYEVVPKPKENNTDPKLDAADVFKTAIRAVRPKAMIESMLQYNQLTSTLKVEDKYYKLNRNIYVVGFGKAVLGMARVVEDMLGKHINTGIISIPQGLQEEMTDSQNREMLLAPNSKIVVYEGAADNAVDESAYEASKAIQNLASDLTENDLLIVLCSGGGSTLCPSPHPPITLQELNCMTRLLTRNGANIKELNTVRKNIEILKGGGLALQAKPAKVLSLILSSIIGDPHDLIASGPTCPSQPTPHHCIEILFRLGIMDRTPESIRKYLEREAKNINSIPAFTTQDSVAENAKRYALLWKDVQNIVVGNNSIACEAAAERAAELGYLPLVLTTVLTGEAKEVGFLYAKLAKFIMMCFDRHACSGHNSELSMLETSLVAGGIKKTWINTICNSVDIAHNVNRDICIIAGGETVVHVRGSGIGGKNMESALAAAIQMKEEFRTKTMSVAETRMCFLSCDSDGQDGLTKMAGAVVDQDFLIKVDEYELDMNKYLDDNDSYTLFSHVNGGQNLVRTKLTGTNIMDIVILMVQKPRQHKYHPF
uniref:Glycerate kinase n=1 Tax=Arion vulgaris TaxID=1028688 RepID=A0A0B7A6G8_9EUPU